MGQNRYIFELVDTGSSNEQSAADPCFNCSCSQLTNRIYGGMLDPVWPYKSKLKPRSQGRLVFPIWRHQKRRRSPLIRFHRPIVPSSRTTLDTLWCLHKTIPYIGENAPTIVTGVKYRKKWSKCLAFINCYLCHFIYVNQNQTPVIEREILPFWTTESNAEKFSAAVKFANEKTPGSYRCFAKFLWLLGLQNILKKALWRSEH